MTALHRGIAIDVSPYKATILSMIEEPARVNAGGGLIVGPPSWSSWTEGSQYSVSTNITIDTNGLSNPAPMEVYRSINYLYYQPSSTLFYFTPPVLVRSEKYKVRLHFSGILFTSPNTYFQKISINGSLQSFSFDPIAGNKKAKVLEFTDVSPSTASTISVLIEPNNQYGTATISGVEVLWQQP